MLNNPLDLPNSEDIPTLDVGLTSDEEIPTLDPESVQLPTSVKPAQQETIEFGHDTPLDMTAGPVAEKAQAKLKSGVDNIAYGAIDLMGGLFNEFVMKPAVSVGNLAGAAFGQGKTSIMIDNENFVDRYLSLQSKAAASEGIYGFLRYEPITEFGAKGLDYITYPIQLLGRMNEHIGSIMADQFINGLDTVEQAVRDKANEKPGGITVQDELAINDTSVRARGLAGAMMRTTPDFLMLAVPAAGRLEAAQTARAAAERTGEVLGALEKRPVPIENLRQLEGYNNTPVSPEEAIRLRDQIANGEISPDVSVETVSGTPTRILTGQDTLRALQMAEASGGIRIKSVKVRYVEKDRFTPQETARLNLLAASGFAELARNEQKLGEIETMKNKRFRDHLVAGFVDQSGNVKRELFNQAGEAGLAAVQKLELISGATPRAQLIFTDLQKRTWGKKAVDDPMISGERKFVIPEFNLHKLSEHDLFDIFAHARRAQEIARYKPGRTMEVTVKGPDGKPLLDNEGNVVKSTQFKQYALEGPINPENAAGLLFRIKQILGDKRFAQFDERLNSLHEVMGNELERMFNEGLIDKASYLKMRDLNYLRREFVTEIDPVAPSFIRGAKVTVPDSGIPFIEHGTKKRAFNTDVETVTAEHIARVERRIAKNNATKALAQAAATGLTSFVKIAGKGKPPAGWSEIHYMDSGVKKSVWMQDNLAAEWVYGDPAFNYFTANTIRLFSGSGIVKSLATGYNPEFAVTNFIRDIQHAWRATGTEYSSFLPLYLGQIGVDLAVVAKDAATKTGRYQDFVMEGGAFEMLSHQGRRQVAKFDSEASIARQFQVGKGPIGQRWEALKEGLGYVNEFSEIVTRLAIRERVLKNQQLKGEPLNPEYATWVARRYLDFSQGGTITKTMDAFIPYLNASAQALRTGLRPYRQGSKIALATAAKDFQIVTLKAALQSRYWSSNQEEMRQVDDETLISNFIIPTSMWIRDDDGTYRPLLLKFPLDNSVVPFTGPIDLLLKKSVTGENPTKNMLEYLRAANPVSTSVLPPTVEALLGAGTNYNFYQNDQIWKGEDIPPGYEYTMKTPEFYRLMGEMFPNSVSPVRLQYMTRTLAPTNTYIYGAEFLTNAVLGSKDPTVEYLKLQGEMGDATSRMFAETPPLRRLVYLGHPNEAMTQIEHQALEEINAQMKVLRDDINMAARDFTVYKAGDPRRTRKLQDLQAKITTNYAARPDILNLVTQGFITKVGTEIAWEKVVGKDMYFPSKDKWVQWAARPPEERAKLFYMVWRVKPNKEERDKMFRIAATIDEAAGKGTIINERFLVQFNKEKQNWGEEYPVPIGGDN